MSASDTEVQTTAAPERFRTADRMQGYGRVQEALPSSAQLDALTMGVPAPPEPQLQAAGSGAVPPAEPPVAVGGIPGASTGDESVSGLIQPPQVRAGVAVLGDEQPAEDLPHRKVGLLGYTTSKEEAPFGNPDWELWGMNNLYTKMTPEQTAQCTRWYQLHSEQDMAPTAEDSEPNKQSKLDHLAWLQQPHPFPIFMIDALEGITVAPDGTPIPSLAERSGRPSAVAFPRALILQHFQRYFTNTVSWEIAHLLWEGLFANDYILSDLGLWGIDMAVEGEYSEQRPSVEFFLGLSNGLGVNLTIPESSDLLKATALYGGDDGQGPFRAKCETRLRELHEQKNHIENQMAQAQAMHASVCGAIDSFSYIKRVWLPPTGKANARDDVKVPAGSLSPVAQMIAEGEARERHAAAEHKE